MDESEEMEADVPSKKINDIDIDIISSLPRNLLDAILSCLPLRDAVRTSILSSKWKYAWASIPVLTFNKECHPTFKEEPTNNRLASIVDHVLLLHIGRIQSFRVSDYMHGGDSHVSKWVVHLSRNGIEELSLRFKKEKEDALKVPLCLFSCEKLRSLVLHHCVLKHPPNFKGFAYLETLDLRDVNVYENTIDYLVSTSPLLEHLTLVFDNHLTSIKFHSPKLKYLVVAGAFADLSLVGSLQLSDVRLTKKNKGANNIELVETYNVAKVLGCLMSLKVLHVESYFLQFLATGIILERLPNSFEHLEFLYLNVNFQDSKEISTALCLFRSSPKLRTIKIMVCSIKEEATLPEAYFWDKGLDCVFNQLKIIKVENLSGEDLEMGFLKFALGNAPVLEEMSVKVAKVRKSEDAKIWKNLLLFRRASALAKIVYLDEAP